MRAKARTHQLGSLSWAQNVSLELSSG